MVKSIKVQPKKRGRGRPATGKDPLYGLRISKALMSAVEAWAKGNGDLSRSAAMRRLIEIGLGKK